MKGDREIIMSVVFCLAFSPVLMKLFNANDPDSKVILAGGYATYAFMPFVIQQICEGTVPTHIIRLLQFLSMFLFACGADLVIALQSSKLLSNFVDFYFSRGEPYLNTPYSIAICYFDSTVHLALYLTLIYRASRGLDYKPAAYILVGSMVNSLVVLLVGSTLGKYQIDLPIILNLPYLFLPLLMMRQMNKESEAKPACPVQIDAGTNFFFGLYFIGAAVLAVVRGLAALGSTDAIFSGYMKVEPYLAHDTAYPKAQAMCYLFYFLPYYCLVLVQMIEGTPPSLPAALVHAGAAAQSQFSHLLVFFLPTFSAKGQLPPTGSVESQIFWITNLLLLVVPIAYAYFCLQASQPRISPYRNSYTVSSSSFSTPGRGRGDQDSGMRLRSGSRY